MKSKLSMVLTLIFTMFYTLSLAGDSIGDSIKEKIEDRQENRKSQFKKKEWNLDKNKRVQNAINRSKSGRHIIHSYQRRIADFVQTGGFTLNVLNECQAIYNGNGNIPVTDNTLQNYANQILASLSNNGQIPPWVKKDDDILYGILDILEENYL